MRRALALLGLAVLLAGCDKEKNVEPPAELVKFSPTLDVRRAWSVGTGGGEKALRLALSPAIADGVAFLAGHDGDVLAVDAETGRTRWKTDLKMRLSAGPGVGGGLVVVGSPGGVVVALAADGGTERWRSELGGEILARPAATATRVVVHTVDGRLVGLDAGTGEQLWSYEQPVPRLSLRGSAPPVVAGDTVLCAFDNGRVAALDLGDGNLLWSAAAATASGRTELERLVDIDQAVRVSGSDVYVAGYQGRVAMLARDSGQIWWARDMSSYGSLALDSLALFISTADGIVVSLRQRDGTELWRQEAMIRRGLTGPAVVGDAVVVGDFEGYVHWLDRQTGALLARERAGSDRISQAPVSASGMVFVQSDGGTVYAFRSRPRG
jgi:outer membrane protein assembly factor BamB